MLTRRSFAILNLVLVAIVTLIASVASADPEDCQSLSNKYAIVANRSFGMAPADVQAKWKEQQCHTFPAPVNVPSLCESMAYLHGIVPNVSFGDADEQVQRSWKEMGCPAKPTPCQDLSDWYGIVANKSFGMATTDVQSDWKSRNCDTSPVPGRAGTLCKQMQDLYKIEVRVDVGTNPPRRSVTVDFGTASEEVRKSWKALRCPATPDPCQELSDRYGIVPNRSFGMASLALRDAWRKASCSTKPTPGQVASLCEYMARRWHIVPDITFGELDISGPDNYYRPGVTNEDIKESWKALGCPITPVSCQQLSDMYGIVHGRTFGMAPADVQKDWKTRKCSTSPTSARAGDLCGIMERTYSIQTYQSGNVDFGRAGTLVQELWRSLGCPLRSCLELSNSFGMVGSKGLGEATTDTPRKDWQTQKCSTSPVPEAAISACINLSYDFGIVPGISFGTADEGARESWKALGCPKKLMGCQELSDMYAIVANKGFGMAPAEVQADWRDQNCSTSPPIDGNLPRLCARMAAAYGIVPNVTFGTAGAEVQKSWIALGCPATTPPPQSCVDPSDCGNAGRPCCRCNGRSPCANGTCGAGGTCPSCVEIAGCGAPSKDCCKCSTPCQSGSTCDSGTKRCVANAPPPPASTIVCGVLSCPPGDHSIKLEYSSQCAGSDISSPNRTVCVANTISAVFQTCDLSCPSGYAKTGSGNSLICNRPLYDKPGDANQITCARSP